MALDYATIKNENIGKYGTEIGRFGARLLANGYADRTHFIFELLQNAEDALKLRRDENGSRSVSFTLSERELRLSHYGKPFTDSDVRGICGIGESTKAEDLTAIGHFGIGFKAVYAFTESPAIYSGRESFAIDSYVWPRAIPAIEIKPDETYFVFPFRQDDPSAYADIASGLQKLGARTLLFLKKVEEISWSVELGRSGLYMRSKPEWITENARQVTLLGEEAGQQVTEETWLIFSRQVYSNDGVNAGCVEIAFTIDKDHANRPTRVNRVLDSRLVVFFPTIVPTNLGFLIQGPYRTTPSRDNVPPADSWNRHLVQETANLLVEALRTLREQALLSVDTLVTLPIERAKFNGGSMFEPLFNTVRTAFETEAFLPTFQGKYVSSKHAKLARTQDLRELLDSSQLTILFDSSEELSWLSDEIPVAPTSELRQYLTSELKIADIVPATLLSRITKTFLESQTDEWIVRFYGFLLKHPALLRPGNLADKPLIRLENGCHVSPLYDTPPQVFLPGATPTSFLTVKKTLCEQAEALELLKKIGLTEPDPVDDVIFNILPNYQKQEIAVDDAQYKMDIERILTAFATDSKSQRAKLISALHDSNFVAAVNTGNGLCSFAQPTDVYLATQRLKELFAGVPDILLLDDTYACLRGEEVGDLLEACGVARYLQPIETDTNFNYIERKEMRKNAGTEDSSGGETIEDFTLRGLDQLLDTLPNFSSDEKVQRAALLWEALCDVEDRRGHSIFFGTYKWKYLSLRSCTFPAAFVNALNVHAWVPDDNKVLQPPEFVIFDQMTPPWKSNPFLLSNILFKPPLIDALAKEAGIDPGALDFLKKHSLTLSDLMARFGIPDEMPQTEPLPLPDNTRPEDTILQPITNQAGPMPILPSNQPQLASGIGENAGSRQGVSSTTSSSASYNLRTGLPHSSEEIHARPVHSDAIVTDPDTQDDVKGRPFISYLGTHPTDHEPDSDGLGHEQRMALEESAIKLILTDEPGLHRTPPNNPGFDLFETGTADQPVRWVEVKAMQGTLRSHPVALSHTQFEHARAHGNAYWLYIVEQAGTPEHARIVRIQDPAGRARSFTFDHGWLNIADISYPAASEQGHEKESN